MKKMLINARDQDLVRVAILDEKGTLEEIDLEYAEHATYKGNIYKAQVIRIEPALGAAFVDFGAPRNGFLPLHEVSGRLLREIQDGRRAGKKDPQDQTLERGQEVLVQATREPLGSKGAALTTYVALPGRYLVYLPAGEQGGISRKIASAEERSKLSEHVRQIRGEKDVGLIVRTAGLDRNKTELQKDFRYLERLWKDIVRGYRECKKPGLVWSEYGAVIRAVRDYYADDIAEVWVDHPQTHEEVRRFVSLTMPQKVAERVKLYEGSVPLFTKYGVEEQIAAARQRRVDLPSGGSIAIDPTEALVSIDVNSGKLRGGSGIEETAFKTNCEAAQEIARQLRLRNLGGIIVIDFIDMRDRKRRADVERTLRDALKPDKANITLGKIGRFGTLEMLRQRMRTSGTSAGFVPCPTCSGLGRTRSPKLAALDGLREIRGAASQSRAGSLLRVHLPLGSTLYLLNERRSDLALLEQTHGIRIELALAAAELGPEAPARIEREEPTASQAAILAARAAPAPQGQRTNGAAALADEGQSAERPRRRRRGSRGGRGRKRPAGASQAASAPRADPEPEQAPATAIGVGEESMPPASPPARRKRRRGSRGGRRRNRASSGTSGGK